VPSSATFRTSTSCLQNLCVLLLCVILKSKLYLIFFFYLRRINSALLCAFAKFRKASSSLSCFVRQSLWNHSAPTQWIFTKSDIRSNFENLTRSFKSHYNPTRITGDLVDDQYHFFNHISLHFFLRYCFRQICRKYQNTHFMFKHFFFLENRAVYET